MKSLEPCGCRHWTQLPISIRPVSPPLPCHRRSITARTVCTALHTCNPIYQCHESAATCVPRLRGPQTSTRDIPSRVGPLNLGPEHPDRLATVDVGKSSLLIGSRNNSQYRVSNSRVCTVNLPERFLRFFRWKYRVVIVLSSSFFFFDC